MYILVALEAALRQVLGGGRVIIQTQPRLRAFERSRRNGERVMEITVPVSVTGM